MTWPRCAGLRDQSACARTPSWVSPLGSGSPFQPCPGPKKWGSSQRSTALGIRLSGGLSRATKSSPRAPLSVLYRMAMCADLGDGTPSRPKPKRPNSPSKRGGTTNWPLGPLPGVVPPGQRVLQSWTGWRVAQVCPATSSKATAMCKHTAAANRSSQFS